MYVENFSLYFFAQRSKKEKNYSLLNFAKNEQIGWRYEG